MKQLYKYLLFATILIINISTSCRKETINININYENKTTQETKKTRINFKSFLNTNTDSRASSNLPLPANCYANIYIYREDVYPNTGKWFYMTVCKAEEAGSLTPLYNAIEIPDGTYNIYATSAYNFSNNQSPSINSSTGQSTDGSVHNGVDYLWFKAEDVDISGEEQDINIIFKRIAVELTFNMEAATGHTLDSVMHFDITPGNNSGCYLILYDGVISPAVTISSTQQMATISGNQASVIILPLATTASLSANIYATVDNVSSWYTVTVNLPDKNEYLSGNEYEYLIIFDGNSLSTN